MNRDEIAAAVLQRAHAYAASHHVAFGSDASHDVERFAGRAADDLARLPPADQQAQLNLVHLAFERLVDEMIAASKQIDGYAPGRIGEQTLARALAKLCPLYPFC